MIAALYDVHGNLPALEATLDDARRQGATQYILGGDYALFGGWPAETVARLEQLENAVWIRGNVDRWTAAAQDAPDGEPAGSAIADCRAVLDSEVVARLGALPERATVGAWLAVHGSPLSDVRSFMPDAGPADDELMAGETPTHLLFGHTHLPFRREHGTTTLVNPGSVGMPLDGDHRAAYALIAPDESVEHRRVDYDHTASAQRLRETFDGPWVDVIAGRLETARP